MASNELQAIFARRRGQGGEEEAPSAAPLASSASNAEKKTGSIADRIAALQKQGKSSSADESSSGIPIVAPLQKPQSRWTPPPTTPSADKEQEDASASAPSEPEARAPRRSSKIQELQGNLGALNMNTFRPGGGGYRRPAGGNSESIMSTGEAYGQSHAMGVRMPGMGSGVPMPGLAQSGRFANQEDAPTESKEPEVSHATMSRAPGPKRRAPTRAPPGAVRTPMATPEPKQEEAAPVPSPAAEQDSLTDMSAEVPAELVQEADPPPAQPASPPAPASAPQSPVEEPVQSAPEPAKVEEKPKYAAPQLRTVDEPISYPPSRSAPEPPKEARFTGPPPVDDEEWTAEDLFGIPKTAPAVPLPGNKMLFGVEPDDESDEEEWEDEKEKPSASASAQEDSKEQVKKETDAPVQPAAVPPPAHHSSLFGGEGSDSDSDSFSDSDDAGGLFGTGVPTSR